MKIISLLSILFPLLYIGCAEEDNKSSQKDEVKVEETQNNPKQAVNPKDLLKELGFDLQNEKISIDINKTTHFFKQMEIEMHGKADEIQHKIEKADINFTRDIGINFSNEKVEIDLNKTKKMFQQINILLKEVLLDANRSKN